MNALRIYAGPTALHHIREHGLQAQDIGAYAGAAGGPKGLVLGPLDRFVFGQWLPGSCQTVDLLGASIGAWRMASACLDNPAQALARLQDTYIHQHYPTPPGRRRPSAADVSARFGTTLRSFFHGQEAQLLQHPRYRLHLFTSRGRHLLRREHPLLTPLGYLGAYLSNAVHRRALGLWMERVVFSSAQGQGVAALPFAPGDLPTRQVRLDTDNVLQALQASCSIPFVLQAVHDIPRAPGGAYWDGGITDYHLHLRYRQRASENPANATNSGASNQVNTRAKGQNGLVLYPHFQRQLVPGWLDKAWRWRHRASSALDSVVVLAPSAQWIRSLPHGKLPDRSDFARYGDDLDARVADWSAAVRASEALAQEWADWLQRPDPGVVQPL
ncbi:MAG: patatin-like phospholipase family protein [Rhodoferax sp.]